MVATARATSGQRAKPYLLRVQKGALVPADRHTQERLRAAKLGIGQVVCASIGKVRNEKFHRLAHTFGEIVAQNVEKFEGVQSHDVLKRLQAESGIGCDVIHVRASEVWGAMADHASEQAPHLKPALQIVGTLLGDAEVPINVPRSLAFGSMEETEFADVFGGLCRHVVKRYWPGLESWQVEMMAEVMPTT